MERARASMEADNLFKSKDGQFLDLDLHRWKGFSTASVHSGEAFDPISGSVTTPIYQTSTFGFPSTERLLEVVSGIAEGNIYTRYGNPTTNAAEDKVAKLEGAEGALGFSSGMAAISSLVLSLVERGDRIVSIRDIYGGTFELFSKLLPRFGVECAFVDAGDYEGLRDEVGKGCKLLFIETPTNPLLKVVDLRRASEIAGAVGAELIVDNTFATPYNQLPIELGADFVVHSATKYLGGHCDILAGVVAGGKEGLSKVWEARKILGGTLDPHAAWLLLRGLKTLALRVERHNENAMKVAEFLEGHPKVKRVYYPGLRSHPDHDVAKGQMRGFGGVVSFEVHGGFKEASALVDGFELGFIAPSLGGVETLITQPVTTSHHYVPKEERDRAGITDGLVRLALGIEDSEDIIAALEDALKRI